MIWTEEHVERIQHLFPKPRGTVKNDPLLFLQALQYMAENGCRWRALPEKFGKWYTIDQRFRRWIDLGVFDEIEEELRSQAIDLKGIKKLALDSTYVKVHPDGTGAPPKKVPKPSEKVVVVEQRKSTASSPTPTCRSCVVCPPVRHRTIWKARS